MTLLNTVNVGGTDFGLLNSTAIGACSTPAGNEVKECTFADSFELKAGVVVTVTFTYANTYGNGSTTYPKLSVNGTSYPIKYATNAYAGAGAWINGQTVPFMFDGTGFILVANLMQTSVISSANTTVNGAPLYNGANIKVMFTSALAGTDTSTALVLNYNGSNITVKVPVNGALADYVAKAVDESGTTAYYFCQAYTTLELLFDGTYFVITNNPVVISNSDYTIYADGTKRVDVVEKNNKNMVTSNATYRANEGEKLFTIRLQGWDSNNQPYDVLTVSRAGYKIANNVYVILAILEPTTSMPAPSSILNLIKVDDISGIQSATLYARGRGVSQLPIPQISGDKFFMRTDSGNWLPSSWQDSYIVASFIVKL